MDFTERIHTTFGSVLIAAISGAELFTYVLQIRDTFLHSNLYLFTLFFTLVWLIWGWKVVLSWFYRPYTGHFDGTASVVIPVVDEPLDLFHTVLEKIVEQNPTEIIVVINGARNPGLEAVCDRFSTVRWQWTVVPGKRNAVRLGVEQAVGDVIVLVDSDTMWTPGTLPELLRPFAEPDVGGVTTRQRILAPERNFLTRWADWLESVRAEYSMPAQSALGAVGCLPGRTIAFRRDVLLNCMDAFMTEKFMGVFLEVSDDRTLTNYTLKQGFKTVYQSTSLVYTDAPTHLKKLVKQQFRWARGSQYNTVRMATWMMRNTKSLCVFFFADIVLPFILLGVVTGWIYRSMTGRQVDLYEGILLEYGWMAGIAQIVALTIIGSVASFGLRQSRHLRHHPGDLVRMPFYILMCTLVLMPIRMYGFLRMAHAGGWGTRKNSYTGAIKRSKNPYAAIPYVLAGLFLTAETIFYG